MTQLQAQLDAVRALERDRGLVVALRRRVEQLEAAWGKEDTLPPPEAQPP